ncbi:MAG: hypothetical protein Q9227_002250 [Pyrenula ochraceoflavens]
MAHSTVISVSLLSFLLQLFSYVFSFSFPSPTIDALEHLLVDTSGFNSADFLRGITPCSNYVSGSQTLGRETSGQWQRVMFHDFVTADISSGTGGVDASIGFESSREENSGSAFNDTFNYMAPYVSAAVSMADLLALGTVVAVGSCGGPQIPLRGGRIDAAGPGRSGVPEPQTNLEETLSEFASAGFNREDAIGLTACGHTMGKVHNGGFPTVVNSSAITPDNTGGGVSFDSTPYAFDDHVVHEYLDWTGQRGGPLVTSFNETSRSDLRLYLSDNNVTMKELSQSSEYFTSRCVELYTRMINTVPSTVTLTDVITPMPLKPINLTLSISPSINTHKRSNSSINGQTMTLTGYIRHLSPSPQNLPLTLTPYPRSSSSSCSTHPLSIPLPPSTHQSSTPYGTATYHPISLTLPVSQGLSGFSISSSSSTTSTFFPLDDRLLFQPRMSSFTPTSVVVVVVAAVLRSPNNRSIANVTATFAIPRAQPGTLAPKIYRQTVPMRILNLNDNNNNTAVGAGGYEFYSANIPTEISISNLIGVGGKGASVDFEAIFSNGDGEVVRSTFNDLSLITTTTATTATTAKE